MPLSLHTYIPPCLRASLHASMRVPPCFDTSISPCLRSFSRPCLRASISPCVHTSMHLHASRSPCLCATVHPSLHPCIHLSIGSPPYSVYTSLISCRYVPAGPFLGRATVKADFVRVDVVTNQFWGTKSEVHMQVSPKEEVITRPVKPGGIPLDIALIMFDSTSAANFKRKMPNTLEYLTKNLNSILLEGLLSKPC